jgi:hypothetical protein
MKEQGRRNPSEQPQIIVEGTPEEKFLLERFSYRAQLFAYIAQERYGLESIEFRRLARTHTTGLDSYRLRWDALWSEVDSTIGPPKDYIEEEYRRLNQGLPGQFQEWKHAQEEREKDTQK